MTVESGKCNLFRVWQKDLPPVVFPKFFGLPEGTHPGLYLSPAKNYLPRRGSWRKDALLRKNLLSPKNPLARHSQLKTGLSKSFALPFGNTSFRSTQSASVKQSSSNSEIQRMCVSILASVSRLICQPRRFKRATSAG
jgi:hypothetical protein